MTIEIGFIIGPAIAILIAWLFPDVREVLKPIRAELLTLSGGYVWLLADIKSDVDTNVAFGSSWKQLNTLLIVSGILLSLTGLIWSGVSRLKRKTNAQLQEELERARKAAAAAKEDYFNLCGTTIKYCFKEFFDSAGGQGRVSLYRHIDDHFVLVGREAQNPMHGKRGRPMYPDKEGFIAKGWSSSPFTVSGFTPWTGKGAGYKAEMKKACSITDDALTKMNMHSTSFYVYRFNNTSAGKPHGIIVFEKMDPSPILNSVIDPAFKRHHDPIVALLKSMKLLG